MLVAFVLGCGLDDDEAASWAAVRQRIAFGGCVTAAEPRARSPRWRPAVGWAAVSLSLALTGGATLCMKADEVVETIQTIVGKCPCRGVERDRG
ncbi:hypothetical protein ACQPZP_34235 [Spirillospora sp. CA-142024]|uniref:hypothetical protein n=1 Tax=Spirillospora sp. CA-142024 TaxID=3240036 RepID=UPI003D8A7E8F